MEILLMILVALVILGLLMSPFLAFIFGYLLMSGMILALRKNVEPPNKNDSQNQYENGEKTK